MLLWQITKPELISETAFKMWTVENRIWQIELVLLSISPISDKLKLQISA